MYRKIKDMFKMRKRTVQENIPTAQPTNANEFHDSLRQFYPPFESCSQPGPSNAHPRTLNYIPVEISTPPRSQIGFPSIPGNPPRRPAIVDPVLTPSCPPGGICRNEGTSDSYRPTESWKRKPIPTSSRYDQRDDRRYDQRNDRRYDQRDDRRHHQRNDQKYDYYRSPCDPYGMPQQRPIMKNATPESNVQDSLPRSRMRDDSRRKRPVYQPKLPTLPTECDEICQSDPKKRRSPSSGSKFTSERDFSDDSDSVAPPTFTNLDLLDEVAEFYHRFPDLHTEVRIMVINNVTIYMLGTNHADPQCPIDVSQIMRSIQPQAVLIELCAWRACGCDDHMGNIFQTKPTFTFRYLRKVISQIGFLPAMIFFTDAFNEHVASEKSLLMDYGAEFAVAAQACNELKDCKIVLADREIPITVRRQASAMGNWRGLKITTLVTMSLLFKSRMKKYLLRGHKLVIRDPHFYQIVVLERDIFLTFMIQAAASLPYPQSKPKIVAVVGQGHLNGIQSFWGRVVPQVLPLILKSDIDM